MKCELKRLISLVLALGVGACADAQDFHDEVGQTTQEVRANTTIQLEAETPDRFWDSTAQHFGNCGSGALDAEVTEDYVGGDCNVAWTTAGEWIEWDINPTVAETYYVSARAASAVSGQTLRLEIDGQNVSDSVTVPSYGSQSFSHVYLGEYSVSPGAHTLRIVFETGDVNLNFLELYVGGTPIPARVEAEDYDNYYELTPANKGGACDRGDGVDMQLTSDPEGGNCNVGWTQAGETLTYVVRSAEPRYYDIKLRVASAVPGQQLSVRTGGYVELLDAPSAGWQSWEYRTVSMFLWEGDNWVDVVFETGNVNLNFVDFVAVGPSCADGVQNGGESDVDCGGRCLGCDPDQSCRTNSDCNSYDCRSSQVCGVSPTGFSLPAARIEAESYYAAYETTPASNAGDSNCNYNDDGVDVENTTDDGYGCNIGWTAAGEWLEYNVYAAEAANYDIVLRLASRQGGKEVRVELDGTPVGTVTAPGQGWQEWRNVVVSDVHVPYGNHTLRVNFAHGSTNFNYLSVGKAGDRDNDGLQDQFETNTGVYVGPTNTGTDPDNPDTDGDGMTDGEEVNGAANGLDLPALGVNPLRVDILLEYDWFEDEVGCLQHTHRPSASALALVTQAFADSPVQNPDGSTGINLINDYGQGGPFTGGNYVADADGDVDGFGPEYRGYKDANFAPERVGYFHYVLMPHTYNNGFSSGLAFIRGDDMIVSLYCFVTDSSVSQTIMHELGHNLGLLHGGDLSTNYKPNYNSVMNYKYQFPGVDNDCDSFGDGVIDFSHGQRISLDEDALDESAGVCGTDPIDWNFNGSIDSALISYDVNSDSVQSTLADYDDWANLYYGTPQLGANAGVALPPQVVVCGNSAPSP